MLPWRSHTYSKAGKNAGINKQIISRANETARFLRQQNNNLPTILTLKHLSKLSGAPYNFLRRSVEHSDPEPYRLFRIHKRLLADESKRRYRIICVPEKKLMAVQRWINGEILQKIKPHPASVAFGPGNSIIAAAEPHCGSRWIVKLDIKNFFESVSEQQVFHVFSRLGYQPLVAFELARLTTRKGKRSYARSAKRWSKNFNLDYSISAYNEILLGHLPQGAPTSPMLANLAMFDFDEAVTDLANSAQLEYTRYADDLTFSTSSEEFSRKDAKKFIGNIYSKLKAFDFEPNLTKTKIVPPGARKIVLGLLVDGDKPRLTKEFRDNIRQHLYYMTEANIGPVIHASTKGFISVYGLKNHVRGLIAHAAQIDPDYANKAWQKFNSVRWP